MFFFWLIVGYFGALFMVGSIPIGAGSVGGALFLVPLAVAWLVLMRMSVVPRVWAALAIGFLTDSVSFFPAGTMVIMFVVLALVAEALLRMLPELLFIPRQLPVFALVLIVLAVGTPWSALFVVAIRAY
ncbi:MAG: hypothetical protein Q8Q94_01720 [bacterium]|nr:hypothetical protein [bacterium]MDZ4299498.1 hypothetical protein [Candidatus Sungbacteria bacterium]